MIISVAASEDLLVYIPGGVYYVSDTVSIPSGAEIVGECWSQIMADGPNFGDMKNPYPMVRVGAAGGETGTVEIQDILFTVRGAVAGAILVEWNMGGPEPGAAAMWDSHFRVGGATGTNLQVAECPTGSNNSWCIAASLLLHLTVWSSAYLENVWAWVADHDLDTASGVQVNVFSARGVLIESQGPTWLYGTAAEHSTFYQYQLSGAINLYMGMIQTESPYYQPLPAAPAPFLEAVGVFPGDPDFLTDCSDQTDACLFSWGLNILDSNNIAIGGAGLYSWFIDYDEDCVHTQNCQQRVATTSRNTNAWINNLYTIGSTEMIVPQGSLLNTAKAADNTDQVAYPWLAVISSWIDPLDNGSGGDHTSGTGNGTCTEDDTREECADPYPICNYSLSYANLEDLLAAAPGLPAFCIELYVLPILAQMLRDSLASYNSVNSGYDDDFGYYVKYIKALVPSVLNNFMNSNDGPGNQYFSCTWYENGRNTTARTCPFDDYSLGDQYWTIYYTLTDSDGFYKDLLDNYGVEADWVTLGTDVDEYTAGLSTDHYKHTSYGFPIAAKSINVPNPKDIITAALPNIPKLQATIDGTYLTILSGVWEGAFDDVTQTLSTAVFLLNQAVDSMAQVKSIGETEEENEKKQLILEILSGVFFFIPFLGEAADAVEGLTFLGRMIAFIGAAGNTALTIVDLVDDPSSALMDIMGLLLSGIDIRDPKSFASMAKARRGMSSDTLTAIGPTFKGLDEKLQSIVKACSA